MSAKLTKKVRENLESMRREGENNVGLWSSRDLAKYLGYSDYRNFLVVMRKAWTSCQNSGLNPYDHFVKLTEMVSIGSNAERQIDTWLMSLYACYLTLQNADPSKPIVAQAQTTIKLRSRLNQKIIV